MVLLLSSKILTEVHAETEFQKIVAFAVPFELQPVLLVEDPQAGAIRPSPTCSIKLELKATSLVFPSDKKKMPEAIKAPRTRIKPLT